MLQIENSNEFQDLISNNSLVLVDFTASWCGPCKMISPIFEQLAVKYSSIKCCKVDVDVVRSEAQKYEITAMPTFKLFLESRVIDEMKGADRSGLEALFIQGDRLYSSFVSLKSTVYSLDALAEMSVKQLKKILAARNVSLAGLAEKKDLFYKIIESNPLT